MPDTARPVSRLPPGSSRGILSTPVLVPPMLFRHVISGSLSLAFSAHTCRAHGATFPTTLTTTALNRSSSGRFAALPCRTAAEGHQATGPAPPSPVQLRIRWSDLLHRASFSVRGTHKIEHRLFSYVSLNWRGRPLESLEVIIDLIAATTTSTGLKVYARHDPGEYEKAIKVTDAQLAGVNIVRDEFHPDWNYTIHPIPKGPLISSCRLIRQGGPDRCGRSERQPGRARDWFRRLVAR
jgi:hypothetical protein